MAESTVRRRRYWADIVVILVALTLVGLAAWNAPVSAGARPDEAESVPAIYRAYLIGGGLALAAVFVVHRWRTAGRIMLLAGALVVLGYGLAGYREAAGAFWLTVVLPGILLLGAAPFFGPMPRANP